jgi:5-methylcytosine-specific restriction endonuclease McrBC regulatory subunit McrC
MSFSQIGTITKAYKEEIERENGQVGADNYDNIKSKSKTTQAIKLFSEDKNLVDVVIALDLPTDEVRDMYRQFLKLSYMRHRETR